MRFHFSHIDAANWLYVSLVLAVFFMTTTAEAAGRTLSTQKFANTFLENEAVQIHIADGAGAPVILRDINGAPIAQRGAPAGATTVDFGNLPPGYYEAVCGDSMLPLVVLIAPEKRVQGDSRLATDNAMSWLVKPEQFEDIARILRLTGSTWVRERLAWGEVEPQRGQFNGGKYDKAIDALHKNGLKTYQIFHNIPAWARADGDRKAAPDDLRDIYRFAAKLAGHYQERVPAWEVWNEPDISFFSHPASECAAFQKAAYLGFKQAGTAQPPLVLGPSLAHGAGTFAEHLLENGTGHYLDIWNYHIYADPAAYATRVEAFKVLLQKHGVSAPHWITEAGDRVDGPEGVLTPQNRRHQAAFISRAFAQALAAGAERHFWFVFPFYKEGSTGWGLFEPNQKAPFPGLAAMSNVTYALGRGDYRGKLTVGDEQARAFVFDRGNGTSVIALWRENDTPAEVILPLNWNRVREIRNHLGTPQNIGQGPARLSVARAAFFIIVDANAVPTPPPAIRVIPRRPKPALSEIVVRLRVKEATVDKDADCYVVSAGQQVPLEAEIYNWSKRPFNGNLALRFPAGWQASPTQMPVTAAPGERAVVPVRLSAPTSFKRDAMHLIAQSNNQASPPAVVRLSVDANSATPVRTLPLDLEKPEAWEKNIAGHGTMTAAAGAEGGVRFGFTFTPPGDPWAYPQHHFNPPIDLSGYDAIRFEYRTSVADSGPVRLMLVENGSSYFTSGGLPGSTMWRKATVLMRDLTYLSLSKADTNGKLDTDHIATIRIGVNAKPQNLTLEVRNITAVKF